MNWLDIVLLLLITGVAVVGLARGFGRAALDALGLYAALWLAHALAPRLAAQVAFAPESAAVNLSLSLGLLFGIFAALCLLASWYIDGMTQMSAGPFDKLFGLVAGCGAGLILAHLLVSVMVTADPKRQASAALVHQGTVGTEMYAFPSYHNAVDMLTGVAAYRREMPNVAGNSR